MHWLTETFKCLKTGHILHNSRPKYYEINPSKTINNCPFYSISGARRQLCDELVPVRVWSVLRRSVLAGVCLVRDPSGQPGSPGGIVLVISIITDTPSDLS